MFCQKCGQSLPDGAHFCSKCGESTSKSVVANESPGGWTKPIIIVIGLTLLLSIISKSFDKTTEATPTPKTSMTVGPESKIMPIELGALVLAFMPGRNDENQIGWDISHSTNVPIEWLSDGLEERKDRSAVRRGRVRVTVDGKKMFVLRQVPEELYWSIELVGWPKGVYSFNISPGMECFGAANSGCDYDFEQAMKSENVATREICAFHELGGEYVVYALSSAGKRNALAYNTRSCGSGGCSDDLEVFLDDPNLAAMSKAQCMKFIEDDYLSGLGPEASFDLKPGRSGG